MTKIQQADKELDRPLTDLKPGDSLAMKLLRVSLGFYLVIALSLTFLQLVLEYDNEKRRLTSELEQVSITFMPILAQSLWNFDEENTAASLKGILRINRDIHKVQILDGDMQVVHELLAENTGLDQLPGETSNSDNLLPGLSTTEGAFSLTYPIFFESEYTRKTNLGTLVLFSSTSVVLQRAAYTFYITLVSAIFKTGFLWLIFYIVMNKMIAKPLKQMTDALIKLNPDTEQQSTHIEFTDAELNRSDELGIMLRTFETMEYALVNKNKELHEYQRGLEEKVAKRTQQLEKASQAKTDFLASMSHEIRTPMNGVLGMAELLSGTSLDPQQQKYLDIIQNSGAALIDIINGILDHLKIEAGKIELENTPFSLEGVIDDCIAIFSYKSRETEVSILPLFRASCPQRVIGDPTRIRQILTNLLGNAFKFTEQGEIIVEVTQISQLDNAQGLIRISVKDSGVGISKEAQQKLFKPFSQADHSTTRKYGGTGLGLSISKQLTELMGGKIGVSSVPGEGALFWVEIPLTVDINFVKNAEELNTLEVIKDRRILVVDDHEAFCTIVGDMVSSWKMHPTVIHLGDQVIDILEQAVAAGNQYDVAIIDLRLPDISGLELSQKIKQACGEDMPKIILVSAHKEKIAETTLAENGILSYIEKPLSNAELRKSIAAVVSEPSVSAGEDTIKQAPKNYAELQVLVAEDNLVNQMVIKGLLKRLGISPDVVENGVKTIEACEDDSHTKYDLILMDCEMPELDGWEATRKIRQTNYCRENGQPILIYALSAHAMEHFIDKAKDSGMDGFLPKPVVLDQLVSVLDKIA
ncbi:MAG: response regulator [Pseudomonadales bacterium]|nr:response regulator [Pseudomonadales bacterium]